ncbi:hypothetical protein OFC53_36805, partial [Escherichia coli]|nr:hypothetical protein [Escherichia coli]
TPNKADIECPELNRHEDIRHKAANLKNAVLANRSNQQVVRRCSSNKEALQARLEFRAWYRLSCAA